MSVLDRRRLSCCTNAAASPAACSRLLISTSAAATRVLGCQLTSAAAAACCSASCPQPHAPLSCSAPPDAFISWPVDSHASSGTSAPGDDDDEPDLVSVTRLPPGADAYSFLAAHSAPDEPEMLSGLCLYTEVFLSKVRVLLLDAGSCWTAGGTAWQGAACQLREAAHACGCAS